MPKIVNRTGIRGDDLRRLATIAMTRKGALGNIRYPIHEIQFTLSRDFQNRGWAWVDKGIIQVQVAKGWVGLDWDIKELGQLLEHEIDHCLGLDHLDMAQPSWWLLDASWTTELKLRLRAGHEPPPIEVKLRCLFDAWRMGADDVDVDQVIDDDDGIEAA